MNKDESSLLHYPLSAATELMNQRNAKDETAGTHDVPGLPLSIKQTKATKNSKQCDVREEGNGTASGTQESALPFAQIEEEVK